MSAYAPKGKNMGMNETPAAVRVQIGFFGRTNAGKSSLVNAIAGQDLSIVSNVKGTTTDPVRKTMELLPLGPVVVVDTPGYDDEGSLGELRVRRAKRVLNTVDIAVLVIDAAAGLHAPDRELIALFEDKRIPYLIAANKCDAAGEAPVPFSALPVSALKGTNIWELKERIARLAPEQSAELRLVDDLVEPGDCAILVTPIDSAAPKGRMILPQQQVLRSVLDAGARAIVVKEDGVRDALASLLHPPKLVITDSQAFESVSADTPISIPLTSFSILMARAKGYLEEAVRGIEAIDRLKDGDRVLIAEGCTHHRQCDDIGTVKIPRWLRSHTGKALVFETCSGRGFPEDLTGFSLVVHCGGCMLTAREVLARINEARDQKVPVTNYGTLIAHTKGILKRSLCLFPDLLTERKS